MIVPLAFAFAVAVIALTGGRLGALADIRVRLAWCAGLAVLGQVVLFEVVDEHLSVGAAALLHVGTYVPAVAFVVANRRLHGLAVVLVGATLNVVAIVANGGVMPQSAWARDRAGVEDEGAVRNSGEVDDPVLLPLGDVLAVPGPWPIGSVFSVGDVLVVAGGVELVWWYSAPGRRRYPTETTSTRRVAPLGASNDTVSPGFEPMSAVPSGDPGEMTSSS